MKAVLLTRHGGPDALEVADVEAPTPGPGEVQIAVKAAAINHMDVWVREGGPAFKVTLPHVLGGDAAGVISALGEQAGGYGLQMRQRVVINPCVSDGTCEFCLAGQENLCRNFRILGEDVPGAYREALVVPVRNVLPIPDGVPFETAAAAALVYLTAWHSLIEKGGLRAGESVAIVGAGGGVNTASIQIAKLAGAMVYVVGSTDEKLAHAEALGADVLINRQTEDWSKAIFLHTGKRGVDVVVDNVGQATWLGSIRALRRGGRMLVVGNTSGSHFELDIRYLFAKQISIIGSTLGTQQTFRTVMSLVFDGRLQPVLDRTFPLEEARMAHEYFEGDALFGKVVLLP